MNNIGAHLIGNAFDPKRLLGPNGAKPRIVKLVDPSPDYVKRVRAAVGPDCLIVIRFWEPEQRLGAPDTDAREWYSRHVAQMLAMTDPNTLFESYNEVGDGQARQYAQFETARLGIMHNAGLRSVVLNSSVGTPDLSVWGYYRSVLAAMGGGDRVGLHEYWPDAAGIDNRWWCGRWEKVPELSARSVIITECGRDQIIERKQDGSTVVHGRPGWKLGGISAEQYVAEIEKYAQVLGDKLAVVFTGGKTSDGWEDFEVNSIWERVTEKYEDIVLPPAAPVPDIFYLLLGPRAAECHTSGTSEDHLANGQHIAYDVAGMKRWPVYAVADGWVDFVTYEGPTHKRGRGHCLGVVHPTIRVGPHDCLEVSPCHLAEKPLVKEGQHVQRGQLLGYTGWTGKVEPPNEYGEHVHLVCYSVQDNPLASPWAYIRPESLSVEIVEE